MFTFRTKKTLLKAILTHKAPLYVQFAVTKNCNLNCRMCGSSFSRYNEKELSLPEIEKLADVLAQLGVGIILLTGGEPFLRKDIVEIIQIFSRKGFTVRLQTNGICVDEQRIYSAYKAGMEEITISLHSLDPLQHDTITGHNGSWQKAIQAMAIFSLILPKRGVVLGVNTVVTRKNIFELPLIVRFVTKIGFFSSLIPVHLTNANDDKEFIIRRNAPEFYFRKEDFLLLDKVYSEIILMKKKGYNIYNSYPFLRQSPLFLKGERVSWHCDSPYLYFAISPSGNFLPCVDIKTEISMLQKDFVRFYHSQQFQQKIKSMVRRCQGCFYACWPEMTYLCRNPFVLVDRIFLGARAILFKRKPISYVESLKIIEQLKDNRNV